MKTPKAPNLRKHKTDRPNAQTACAQRAQSACWRSGANRPLGESLEAHSRAKDVDGRLGEEGGGIFYIILFYN